jgi:hypothetical protein
MSSKYEDWLNRVNEDGQMLSRAMREEIYKIILDFTPEGAVDEIMDLVYVTRYEW